MKLLKAFGQALFVVFAIILGCLFLIFVIAAAQYGPVWAFPAIIFVLVVTLFTVLFYDYPG